jgi:hypothetical protein
MHGRLSKQITVAGLLGLVAVSAVVMSLLRPPGPPDEVEAIMLAKTYLQTNREFDYPTGYWVRAAWDQKLGYWRVGFLGAGGRGSTLLLRVSPDRSCRAEPMDISFFDLR